MPRTSAPRSLYDLSARGSMILFRRTSVPIEHSVAAVSSLIQQAERLEDGHGVSPS